LWIEVYNQFCSDMKKIISLLVIGLMLGFNVTGNEIPEKIVTAFRTGNASELAAFFNSTLELTVNNKEEIYSKTQAEIILKDFFTSNPPSSFTILHQGGKESSKYAIGSLKSGPNNFRITFLLKSVNSDVFIHQLRIENANAE
jgi:hypothetical protein